MCGAIARDWPRYSPFDIANLPLKAYRSLRALYIRAHHVPDQDERREGVKNVDMDKELGIKPD